MKDIIDYNWSSKIMFIIIFSKLKMGLKKNSVKKIQNSLREPQTPLLGFK